MEANEIQIGGDHYIKNNYQHWDFVCDSNLHYLLGCATKYISRWRDKNGLEDLKKPNHYLIKATEQGVRPPTSPYFNQCVELFVEQLVHETDKEIIRFICLGEYQIAQSLISDLVIGHTVVDKD
tara:strand:- start:5869 stop:6240 length:372 start_codon:yes stop_codon:yes gene_type:complete